MADRKNLSVNDATEVVTPSSIPQGKPLVAGDRVEIRGFGSFKMKGFSYAGRNPWTGNRVVMKPKRLPFFRPGNISKSFLARGGYRLGCEPPPPPPQNFLGNKKKAQDAGGQALPLCTGHKSTA